MSQPILRRQLGTECRVLDVSAGIVEYVASDETIDSYGEVIRAKGWKFDRFAKNAPFVDSHNYSSVACLLGNVTSWRVSGAKLIEQVKFIPEGKLVASDAASLGAGKLVESVAHLFETREYGKALREIMAYADEVNLRFDGAAPWKLVKEGKSLLPIGVVEVAGDFGRGDVVTCVDASGRAIARGISNYASAEVRRILRKPSSEIAAILGYMDEEELIHRDNLVLV